MHGDTRPSKEREEARWLGLEQGNVDVEFEKYGYVRPAKIKPGHLTLKQFDEMLLEYKAKKSPEVVDKYAAELKIEKSDILILLEYFKPLYRIDKGEVDPLKFENVFTNVKKLEK